MSLLVMVFSTFAQEFEKHKLWVCLKEAGSITTRMASNSQSPDSVGSVALQDLTMPM